MESTCTVSLTCTADAGIAIMAAASRVRHTAAATDKLLRLIKILLQILILPDRGKAEPSRPMCRLEQIMSSVRGGSTCANRMLRMKEAADGLYHCRRQQTMSEIIVQFNEEIIKRQLKELV